MRQATKLQVPLLLLLAACTAPASSSSSRAGAVPVHDAETFYATTSISGADFSPDGKKILVTSDRSGVFNAWAQPADGGPMEPLTHSTTNAVYAVSWFKADGRFLFTADQGGNELTHLYVREPDGAEVDLTPGTELKAQFVDWAADGRSFFALTNERDPKIFDLYRYIVAGPIPAAAAEVAPGYSREIVYTNPGGYDVSDLSRDGRLVALTKTRNNADSDVYLVDLAAPADLVHVTPHEGDVQHSVTDFSPDGAALYYTSNVGSEFDRVWAYDLASKERKVVFQDDWDVVGYEFSEDGRFLVATVNADARTKIRVFEAASGRERALPEVGGPGGGDVSGIVFEDGGDRMAFYVTDDTSPANLYLTDLSGGAPRRLTDARNPAIEPADLVEAEIVRYPSFDGLAIPALLYRPKTASASAPAPALVWVHGGPGGQSRKGYSPTIQHLVNHGYAVLAVNNRGSSGYGKTFNHLDDRKHGDVDLQDCIFGRRYLEGLDWVDGERVGIVGGSYGGYMVCAALAFAPEAFDVGIDIFGVTNWLRTLESIPPWWADFRDALYAEMGDPKLDKERLEARSPLFHAKNIVRPLLVVQGANDPRVLQAESDEIVAAARANGVAVEYVLFPDEGHGFKSKKNRITASEAFVRFLDLHLKRPRA
jgi:dipeptidyl aminopeptidase/acylaminoacyl peptidase